MAQRGGGRAVLIEGLPRQADAAKLERILSIASGHPAEVQARDASISLT